MCSETLRVSLAVSHIAAAFPHLYTPVHATTRKVAMAWSNTWCQLSACQRDSGVKAREQKHERAPLVNKVVAVQVESKLFYLDLKRNARGRYLKIAEKGTNRERSTIIVPYTGIMWFRELFNYYAGGTNEQG